MSRVIVFPLLFVFAATGWPAHAASQATVQTAAVAAPQRYLVQFESRSFDLSDFREANLAKDAERVADIVRRLEARVRRDQASFVEAVEELGGRVVDQWWIVNGCAIEIASARLESVRALAGVSRIEADGVIEPTIKASTNSANHNSDFVNVQGFTGLGVTAAIVDTGQDENMASTGRAHRIYYVDGDVKKASRLVLNRRIGSMPADDSSGHGTAIAGIVAGASWGTVGADDGHAPRAGIAGYSIANNRGGGSSYTVVVRAWQTIAADAVKYKIVAANNSYSGTSDPTHTSQQALDSCARNADILISVSAGVVPDTSYSQSAANGLAVGAVAANTHVVANLSPRGPLAGDAMRFYPDLVGTGVGVVMPTRDDEAKDYVASGTSLAAPQICGVATLVRGAVPTLRADETKAILIASTLDISLKNASLNRNAYGLGLSRSDTAITMARDIGGHGRGSVTAAKKTWTGPVAVKQGSLYRACIAWMRTTLNTTSWSNLDLEILDGSNVVATSNTARNLYEAITYRATKTGTLQLRVTAVTLDGTTQDFAWAFGEGSGPPAPSQIDLYGGGCPSASQGCVGCVPVNWTKTLTNSTTVAKRIGIMDFSRKERSRICGVDLYCRARSGTVDVNVAIYSMDNTTSNPGVVLRSARVKIGTTAAVYRANFSPAIDFGQNDLFFLVFDQADKLILPESTTGTIGYHWPYLNNRWGTVVGTHRWQYTLRCDRGLVKPELSTTGRPILGQVFQLNLAKAPPNRAGIFLLGFSDKAWGPLQLPHTLVSTCQILASGEFIIGVVVNGVGRSSVSLRIPADKTLLGSQIFNQFLVPDAAANALGWVVSNACKSTFGEK